LAGGQPEPDKQGGESGGGEGDERGNHETRSFGGATNVAMLR
jgi:hypothetical protein